MDTTTLGIALFIAAILGVIPGSIATYKGRSFFGWWLFGAALFIVALPAALIVGDNEQGLARRGLRRRCPHCAEPIRRDAVVCRFCGRDVVAGSEPQ